MEDFAAIGTFEKVGPDIGLTRCAVMTGVAKVFGIIRVAAVAGKVVLFDPQARVIAAGLIVVGRAMRPVAIDAESPLVSPVRREAAAILSAGPQGPGGRVKVAAAVGVTQRVTAQTEVAHAQVEQVAVAATAVGTPRFRVVWGMAGHADDPGIVVQR